MNTTITITKGTDENCKHPLYTLHQNGTYECVKCKAIISFTNKPKQMLDMEKELLEG